MFPAASSKGLCGRRPSSRRLHSLGSQVHEPSGGRSQGRGQGGAGGAGLPGAGPRVPAALTVAPAGPPGAHGAVQDAVHPHQEPADAEAEQQPQHEVDLLLGDVVCHEVVLGGVHHRLVPVVRDHVVDVVPGGAGRAGTSPAGRAGIPAGVFEAALWELGSGWGQRTLPGPQSPGGGCPEGRRLRGQWSE